MNVPIYHDYLSHGKPLQHYFHHYLIASIGLFFCYRIFGSITVWEVLLFYFASFMPLLDEFVYSILNYLDEQNSRMVVNQFIIGDFISFLHLLHDDRKYFLRLLLHNVFTFLAFWGVWYACFTFEVPAGFYFISGILTHLFYDLLNDQYELSSIKRWFWPALIR